MQAAGFDLERGIHGSKANHMDPAVYNAIKEEEAKLEAEKDELKMQKEVLEDEVDMLLSWEVAMSTCLVLVVVLSVAKLVGTVARKTRRTRTSDSVVGFMQQRPSKLRDMCQQRGKGIADEMLFIEHSHQMEKGVSAFFIIRIRASCSFLQVSPSFFLTKKYKYCRLSLWSCDSLQLFLYLCSQNLTNQIEDYV